MGLQEVKKGLELELKQRSSQILKEAEQERQKILAEAASEAEKIEEGILKDTNELISQLERSEIAGANLHFKKNVLHAKKKAVDDAFEEAAKKMVAYPSDKKKKVLKALVEKAAKEIDVAKVYCNKVDAGLISDYDTEVVDMVGGVICESSDGNSRVDLTFDTMLDEIRDENLKEIAGLLFK